MTRPLSPELLASLQYWGPRWHQDITAGRDAMLEAWAPLLSVSAIEPTVRDVPYGEHPRQVLDVFAPEAAANLPILVFVHGGAFVRGDKEQTPLVYANVPAEFSRHGFLAFNVEYRLAPEASWPAGAEDVRDAILWVARHAEKWGGDPTRIFLMGHSAACAHCASAVWDDRVRPPEGLPVAGLALVSPRVVADTRADNPNAHGVRAYYGEDAARYAEREPIGLVRPDAPPTLIALAQYENPLLDFYALELAHRLAAVADQDKGPMPRVIQLMDHNHVSIVAQFSTPCNELGVQMCDWFERVLRGDFGARKLLRSAKAASEVSKSC
ncbi:alpha/beta hydrolase [Verminephrobacter eiseniae]|uniref:alpha/beta hydrolase n=2 Tax=Verminephrobacter eiseniae TaxID=364317 RepID=UPI002238530A|nr:alpha/beta hydrolase [Verminephrobacter eiseniae]MCW5232312.1 alpha/beta hydrolase [Verminephrobacter eiseniae]MCW5296124.1 alpha/beta hydrolase [Verminephrobacter eiseniae]MCW8186954.1 alpha/beta hydrolase [Verminephrobacter eiseniae]MCW8225340.1 alpha/beta hydrolase [Verminephrobacter eiseniae]MCW8236332.1 alpha/beta hydrolase [Verminephrobacter eiseniae]